MQTVERAFPVQQRAVLHLKHETNVLQRSAVLSAPPRSGVRAATQKLLVFQKCTLVFPDRPSPFLSLFLAESPPAESGWAACESVKFLTAAPGLASCFYFTFASSHRADEASHRVKVQCWHSGPWEASLSCARQPASRIPPFDCFFSKIRSLCCSDNPAGSLCVCSVQCADTVHCRGRDHRCLCA